MTNKKNSNQIKGVQDKVMWAVFAPDGYLQYRTIADTQKEAKERTIGYHEKGDTTWDDYAANGYTTNKILVDIKLL
jgi:hypothetical protein